MLFPKFWRKTNRGQVVAWGWSDESPEAAQAEAEQRMERMVRRLQEKGSLPKNPYGYPDRPLREEMIREFPGPEGAPAAIVSRNAYGCLVLNTAAGFFVDVDEPEPATPARGWGEPVRDETFEPKALETVARWVTVRPDWGWRVYRTKAGLRLLATHDLIRPDNPVCEEVFREFGADPLYRKLCRNQQCFRARLTPKPWRCGVENPRLLRWPRPDPRMETAFRDWERCYLEAAADHATCRLLGQFGQAEIHPALRELVAFHDTVTRIDADLPLA